MDRERKDLVAEVARLRRAMMESAAPRWAGSWKGLDLTIGQLKLLVYLSTRAPMRMSALAQHLGIALPSCTSLIDRLARAGMVERQEDPSDRRLVLCALSEQGLAAVTKLRQASDVMSDELLRRLTTDELRVVAQALAIFQRALAAMHEAAPADAAKGDVG